MTTPVAFALPGNDLAGGRHILKHPNPVLLSSFLAVVETQSFTFAARRLGLRQSTVSQHILKLENAVGRRLLTRDTHTVRLTIDGQVMVEFARNVLDSHERIYRYFNPAEKRDRIRLGVSEDIASSFLSGILERYAALCPNVDLEITVGLSSLLYGLLDFGSLDLLFAKRVDEDPRGLVAWQENLVWVGRDGFNLDGAAVPLIVFPLPSITRVIATQALEHANLHWRIACTCSSLSAIWAAARAGLGITAQSSLLLPEGLATFEHHDMLPPLAPVDFVVVHANRHISRPVEALTGIIMESSPYRAGV